MSFGQQHGLRVLTRRAVLPEVKAQRRQGFSSGSKRKLLPEKLASSGSFERFLLRLRFDFGATGALKSAWQRLVSVYSTADFT